VQIVVASKFDNRLKEFSERWEVDRYLSAAGYLSANVKPFFVALPKVGSPGCPVQRFPETTLAAGHSMALFSRRRGCRRQVFTQG
jgi:hypothetical protein